MPKASVTVKNLTPNAEGVDGPGLDNDPMYHLTRVFVYFLQNLFRDFPEGCGMQWKPGEETSELVISNEKPTMEAVEKRPHIICVLGGSRFSGIGLDQMQNVRASDGQRTHTDLIPISMNYHCQAKAGMHARRVAWNAALWTVALRRIIMRVGGLFQVATTPGMSPEGPISQFTGPKAESELVEVIVNVPFYWQPQWRIKRASEVWRHMEMTMNVRGAGGLYSAGKAMQLRPPMVKGVPVSTTPISTPPANAFSQKVTVSSYFDEEE